VGLTDRDDGQRGREDQHVREVGGGNLSIIRKP
jgi:hypothetical protein